jgi:hypothetical protein
LQNSDPTKKVKLKRQIILSDEGSGLKRFCRKSSFKVPLTHFFCHRHIIQAFGASGLLGQLVKQALATQSKRIYDGIRPQLLRTARRALRDKKITRRAFKPVRLISVTEVSTRSLASRSFWRGPLQQSR